MRKIIVRVILCITAFVVIGVGLLLLRNYQMSEGVRALKNENGVSALKRLKPLAQLGDKTAQMLIGSIYAYGWGGVSKNDDNAIYWFRRCGPFGNQVVEKGGDPAAPHALSVAKAYANGENGLKADHAESVKWLKFAAKGGSKEASKMLGVNPQR